jgi:hypothetical protein
MPRSRREKSKKRPQPPPIPQGERRRPGRPCTPLIPVDTSSLGPAMVALSPAMRAFVVAKVTMGLNNIDAAKTAGYSARSPHALGVVGSRLAHDDRVQVAILEEGQKLMRTEGPRSVHTLVAIRDDKAASNKDRLTAAKELLDRSGFHATTEHHVSVEHSLSDAEKDRRMLVLAAELGISQTEAQKLLIAPAAPKAVEAAYENVLDAEFEQVEPTEAEAADALKRDRDNELRRQRRSMTPEQLAAHRAEVRQQRVERGKVRAAQVTGREGLEDLLD